MKVRLTYIDEDQIEFYDDPDALCKELDYMWTEIPVTLEEYNHFQKIKTEYFELEYKYQRLRDEANEED